ncbi:MAG: hypothetical protein HOH19_00370 [Kordiimonadaceae bacterium]|jgi:hypothetical protein|nr:hypothetical protein [Kordiimonadaceae bacterium]
MILRRFMKHVTDQNWFAVTLDVIVVIVGIYLGLQVQEWNKDREEAIMINVFAQSMIEDLQADTKVLNQTIIFSENKLSTIESFLVNIQAPQDAWDVEQFYLNMNTALRIAPFKSTDGTYQQLKASGSLQFFDQALVNKMNAYDHQIKNTEFRDDIVERAEADFLTSAETIINYYVLLQFREDQIITQDMYIRFEDQEEIDVFINTLTKKREVLARALEEYRAQLIIAQSLLNDLILAYPATNL